MSENNTLNSNLSTNDILSIKNMHIKFPLHSGTIHAINNVNIDIEKGKFTALVGESGSGKSTLASAILNIVSSPGVIESGEIYYEGKDILKFTKSQLQKYKWKEVSMVFQAAQNALNPLIRIKDQIIETFEAHHSNLSQSEMYTKTVQLMESVRLQPEQVLNSYPHELSGGMKQRVMIAFSMLLDPKMIILDEPTTALDVITQAYIFEILENINKNNDVTMLLLTHDIAVVAKVAEKVGVMYAGNLVEMGDIYQVFHHSKHPYTNDLIRSAPSLVDDLSEKKPIKGAPPDLLNLPKGCPFYERCIQARDICKKSKPVLKDIGNNHLVACHIYNNDAKG